VKCKQEFISVFILIIFLPNSVLPNYKVRDLQK